MKKLMIVGASILQLPAILQAKRMGMEVAVADFNPQAVGIPYADRYYNCSTIDERGLLEAVRDYCPDGIMTMATDMPMRAIAYVCEQTGLRGIDARCARNCTDKAVMIRCFESFGVPAPRYAEIASKQNLERLANDLPYPCILKPADNSGSRGVYLARDAADALQHYAYTQASSRNGVILAEEFMQGREISVETFVCDGKAVVLQITDKQTSGAPHFVETGHSQPSTLARETQDRVREIAQQACDAVGLTNGPAHIEMMVTSEGPKLVEMGARMGGDCITSHLVPLSTGIDMIEATIRQCVGEAVDLEPKYEKASAIVFLSAAEGVIREIRGVDDAKRADGVRAVEFFKQIGDRAVSVHSSADRVGYVVAQADTPQRAMQICELAAKKIQIVTEV